MTKSYLCLMKSCWFVFFLAFCLTAQAAQKLTTFSDVYLGISEQDIAASKSLFYFDDKGHLGERVQYTGIGTDNFGGTYLLFCHNGRCFGVEVDYPGSGINRKEAVHIIYNLLKNCSSPLTEHDDADLRLHDASAPGEFFYFGSNARAELCFKPGGDLKVTKIGAWSN